MERAVGAFLVTFFALTYLFGESEGTGAYLLVVTLVSAAVAAGAAWWLRPGTRSRSVDAGAFDERATRRAVRRGVARTALVAVVWAFLGLFVLGIASGAWQTRGDRDGHFADVAGYGFFVSHPGFHIENGRPSCCTRGLRWIGVQIQAAPRTADPLASRLDKTLKLDLRNRLEGGPLASRDVPRTGVDIASPTTSAKLAQLPSSVVATAVVELRKGQPIASFYRLLGRHGFLSPYASPDVAVFLQPANTIPGPGPFSSIVSWPNPNIAQFQAWVKTLRASDDGVLEDLQVPPVATLRRIAQTPRVYGCVLDRATPKELQGLMRDPAVKELRLGDVAFEAGRPSQ